MRLGCPNQKILRERNPSPPLMLKQQTVGEKLRMRVHVELHSVLLLDGEGHRRRHGHHLPVQTSMLHLQELEHSSETERMKRLREPRMKLCVASNLRHKVVGGIENATVGEKGAVAGLHQDPGLHLGRQKLDEPGATAHHARPAHRHAVVLAPGQSPLHRRHLQFDEDHDLFNTLRLAGGATVTHDHDQRPEPK
jgi:hypothetical protein